MTEPIERDDLAGDLATVTDEEWRTAHERLVGDIAAEQPDLDTAVLLGEQFAYEWSPADATE